MEQVARTLKHLCSRWLERRHSRTHHHDLTLFQEHSLVTVLEDRVHIMGHKQNGLAIILEAAELAKTLLLKQGIAHG